MPPNNKTSSIIVPICLLLVSMSSVQGSASLAKHLFPLIGPLGMTSLRLLFSAIMLSFIFRPWHKKISKQAWKPIIIYGIALGGMNLAFYSSIQLIPLGVAVALEFSGPLAVAMFASRRVIDFLWVGLAVVGLLLLLPLQQTAQGIDQVGVILALIAGGCWALYIIFGKKAATLHGSSSVAIGSLIALIALFPFGVAHVGSEMFSWSILPIAFVVAMLASALPYGLEMIALPKLPASTFGILMSLSPALAALSGFVFLHENLTLTQWIALCCVITASIGATLTINKPLS